MSADPSHNSDVDEAVDKEQGFLSHLVELRDRLLRMFLAVLICFLAMFPFANTIYAWMATPLLRHLPEGSSMIAIEVASPFLIPLKVVLMVAVFITIPYILYQIWAFVAPGLYRHERRLVLPLLVSSTLLFFLGVAFAFFVVFPLAFAFLTGFTPAGVQMMTDIGKYLDFVITIFFAFGIAFEVPVATVVLVLVGVTTPDDLRAKRPYVIVGAFVVGMLLTPPDIISQTLLAIPMWALFEVGIIASKFMMRRKDEAADASRARDDAEAQAAASTGTVQAYDGPATETDPEPRYRPMTDEEMDEELDRIEREEEESQNKSRDDDGPAGEPPADSEPQPPKS